MKKYFYLASRANKKNNNTYLGNGDEIFCVDGGQTQLLNGQMKWANADASHMLGPHRHLGQETIDQINGREQNIAGQIVPDFQASQNMSGTVTRSNRYLTFLRGKNAK